MPITSAKDIFAQHNFLDPNADKKRHPKHEFQAFAYKLAYDLNDLDHLIIYMRIAKTMERHLVERAYSYAIDSTSDSKAKVFLWKIKQVREEVQRMKDSSNFEYDFVMKKMKRFRNKIVSTLQKDYEKEDKSLYGYLDNLYKDQKIKRVLNIGIMNKAILELGVKYKHKITILDIADQYCKDLKSKIENLKFDRGYGPKVMSKDFFAIDHKDTKYDLIIVDSFWNFLPFDYELKFLTSLAKILSSDGRIIINLKNSGEKSQVWKRMNYQNEDLDYFVKYSNLAEVEETFLKCGFKMIGKDEFNGKVWYLLETTDHRS